MQNDDQVLLVDDDDLLCHALGSALKEFGYAVTACRSGAEALRRADAAGFDILVTDYEMSGMKGTELARRMRQLQPRVFIVGMSGHEVSDEFFTVGADRFLRKPVQPETLRLVLAGRPGRNI